MEQSREAKLVKNTLIYTVSNFGSKVLTFLIVPLYTYYLTTEEFGTYDTIISFMNLLAPICILAIHEGLLRWLLKSNEKHGDILGSGLGLLFTFIVITDTITFVVCLIFHWKYTFVFIALLTAFALHNCFQFIARGEKENKVFAISGIIYTMVMLSLNILFVMVFRFGVQGMLWSMTLAYCSDVVYLIFSLRKKLRLKEMRFNKTLAFSMLSFSIMLVPNSVSWWIMNASDRIMLTMMVGAATTGIYSLANKFPSIVTILHSLFYQAWQEQAVLEYDSEGRDTYYTNVFNTYMKLACCAVAVLIPLSKIIILFFMNKSYASSYQYLGILYLGSLFSSFAGFYGTGYISAKDTKNAMKTTIVGAVINLIVNLLLIPVIDIWAACLSTVCGNIVVWAMRVKHTKKYFKISVDWKSFYFIMIVNVAFTFLNCFCNNIITFLMIGFAIVISIVINKTVILNAFYVLKKKVVKK